MTVIRPATAADADAIRALVQEAYARYVPRIGARPQPMDDDYPALITAGEVWVGEGAGGVAGVLVIKESADHLLVHNVAVAESVRGTGLGAALLGFAEAYARDHGLGEVRLFTNIAMTENLAYYPRRGFRRTGEAEVDGFRRVYFTKIIAAQEPDGPG